MTMSYVRPVDFAAFPPADFRSQFIGDRNSGVESCMLICTRVPPGKGTTAGLHVHPADQFYYILRGRMNVQIGNKEYVAEPNSLVFIPAGAPHWNWNDGAEDELHAEIIVPTPGHGLPISYRVSVPDLARDHAEDDFFVRRLDESRFNPERFSSQIIANRESGSRGCRINVVEVPPGGRGPGLHVHIFDQFYYVISGEMKLQIGSEQLTAGPNTYVMLPAGVPHANWNEGRETERHLALLVPEPPPGAPLDVRVSLGA